MLSMRHSSSLALAAVLAAFAASGPLAGSVLEIQLRHSFQGESLLLDSMRYRDAAGEALSVTRLSYLLGGFALEREDGTWAELADSDGWIDAGRGRTTLRLQGVPPAKYRALRFFVGPDPAANAAKPERWPPDHPLNPSLNGLHWSWQGR